MTPDEIKKMSDEELSQRISELTSEMKGGTWRCYSTDLNAAWGLQYDADGGVLHEWADALDKFTERVTYPSDPRRCARLISEAYLYLKTKGEAVQVEITKNARKCKTPSQSLLKHISENLRYCDGSIFWCGGHRLSGKRAGGPHVGGYRQVRILGERFLEHRVIWFLCNGTWPAKEIDHIDRDKLNNKIENLRTVDSWQNKVNAVRASGRVGIRGVVLDTRSNRYQAHIRANNKFVHLGMFPTAKDAEIARLGAEKRYHGEFSPSLADAMFKERSRTDGK